MMVLQQSEATAERRRIPVLMVDATDGYSEETGLTPGATISKNGAAYGAGGGSVTEVGNGLYYYAASAGDLDTLGFLAVRVTDAAARTFEGVAQVVAYDPYAATAAVFSDGSVWLDTVNGAAGGLGTPNSPTNTIANALIICAAQSVYRIHVATGSSVTLAATVANYTLTGERWTLALGGQSVSGSVIEGAAVSGTCTGATPPRFVDCTVNSIDAPPCTFVRCGFVGDLTMTGAGSYQLADCRAETDIIVDFGAAVGACDLVASRWSGSLELDNMGQLGADTARVEGDASIVIESNCTGGTLTLAGNFAVTDNSGGAVTIVQDARFALSRILSDSTAFQGARIDAAVSSRSSHSAADVNTTLSGAHGAGSWATATGFSTHSANDVNVALSAAHGAGAWNTGLSVAQNTALIEVWQRLGLDSSNPAVHLTATEAVNGYVRVPASGATISLSIARSGSFVTVTRL